MPSRPAAVTEHRREPPLLKPASSRLFFLGSFKQTLRLRPNSCLHDSQVEFVEEVFDEKVVWTEHLDGTMFFWMFAKNALQVSRDVPANPLCFERRARLHDLNCAIRSDEQIGHGLSQRLADDQPLAARFAKREIAGERELLSSGSKYRTMGHEGVCREISFRDGSPIFGFARCATSQQECKSRRKKQIKRKRKELLQRQRAARHGNSSGYGPWPTAFLIIPMSIGLF